MASRDKKSSLTKKQTSASPIPPKDVVEPTGTDPQAVATGSSDTQQETTNQPLAITKSQRIRNPSAIARSLRKPDLRKNVAVKKPLTLSVNSRAKLNPAAGNKVRKAVLRSRAKGIAEAKKVLKNGLKKVVRKKDAPLLVDHGEAKREIRKRKHPTKATDVPIDTINECIDSIIAESNKPIKKAAAKARKVVRTEVKTEVPESTEDTNEINPLIGADEIKKELTSDTDSVKPIKKPIVRKQKPEQLRKKITKENLENKMETSNTNIIDMLDLNVPVPKKIDPKNRRHSIEKFSISLSDTSANSSIFGSMPRSNSPRTRRLSKIRQSMDIRRSSPYTTRSDSPARTLRNGKHRKLKHLNLLEGLDHDYRKRKRLCSDFSGSEVSVSKLSGYESDSSYSDLASLPGAETTADAPVDLKTDADVIKKELLETYVNNPPDTPITVNTTISATSPSIAAAAPAVVVKRSISMDQSQQPEDVVVPTDTNSNLYTPDATQSSRADKPPETDDIQISPSFKVPEKSFILENMKANFNTASAEESQQSKQLQQLEIAHQKQLQQSTSIQPQTSTSLQTLERGKRTTRSATKKPSATLHEIASTSSAEDTAISPAIFYSSTDVKPDSVAVNPVIPVPVAKAEPLKDVQKDLSVSKAQNTDTVPEKILNTPEVNQKPKHIPEIKLIITEQKSKSPELKVKPVEKVKVAEKVKVVEIKPKVMEPKLIAPKVQDNKLLFTGHIVLPALIIPMATANPPPLPEPMDIEDSITAHKVGFDDKFKTAGIVETPEDMAVKENILSALGLQSLRAAEEAAKMRRVVPGAQASAANGGTTSGPSNIINACGTGTYSSGTLKTVIKLNRERTKKPRSSLKMTLQKSNKPKSTKTDQEHAPQGPDEDEYKVMKEKSSASSSWKQQTGHSSDTAGAQRKTHYSNRSNLDGSSEHTSDGDTNIAEDGNAGKLLVIPEKASSFSIHPGRVCKDECTYCFGKFGLFDTPCHIGSMKSAERQEKILNTEKHLTRDSCLCDACFRHVDRKSNAPSYLNNKNYKRNTLVGPGPRQNHCHVLGCANESTNILKRKWIIKMRKAVCEVINIDLDNPGLHSIPVCEEHYSALEHLMICAMCKRRLARNHIHYLGPESTDLNAALNEMGIPVKLCNDRPVVCKLCKYFATLILKSIEDKNETTLTFEREYRKRLLHFHDVQIMNEEDAEGPIPVPTREKVEPTLPQETQQQQEDQLQQPKKRRKIQKSHSHGNNTTTIHSSGEHQMDKQSSDNAQRADSPSDYMVDYQNLIPAINIETGSDHESNTSHKKDGATIIANRKLPILSRKTIPANFKMSSLNSVAALRSDVAVKRLNSNTSISVRQLFPGEEDLPLNAHIDFNIVKERTPEGWEKCNTTIQYDVDTKSLWHELQKPYGNQSSFLRHLILLEKYFRNGDLVLSPNASHHSSNYTESVQNRLRAYDNIPSLSIGATTSGNASNNRQEESSPSVSVQQLQPLSSLLQQYNKPPLLSVPPNIPIQRKSTPPALTAMSGPSLREPPLLVNAANIPKSTPISLAHLTNLVSNSGAATLNLGSSVATTVSAVLNNNTATANVNTNAAAIGMNGLPATGTPGPSTNNSCPPKQSKIPPPGLISLQPGTNKPVTPLVKVSPPSQKIKFPITKNWRPNLIPIDPTKKIEKRTGLVQVISGGKPYHITLEDYKKMCAIKRTFDLRQKRLQEQKSMMVMNLSGASPVTPAASPVGGTVSAISTSPPQPKPLNNNSSAAAIKSLVPRKSLTISKTAVSRAEETPTSALPLNCSTENSLEKLDKHVENIEMQFNADKSPVVPPGVLGVSTPSPMMHMPKIPKSLTVIPQTVVRKLDTNAPGLPISASMSNTSGGPVVVTTSAPSGSASVTQSASAAALLAPNQKVLTSTTASLIAARPLAKS